MVQSISSSTNPYQQYQLSYLYPSLSPAASELAASVGGGASASNSSSASAAASSDDAQTSSAADVSSTYQQFDAALKAALLQFQTTLDDDQANQLASTSQATSSAPTSSANTASTPGNTQAPSGVSGHHHHHHHASQASQGSVQDPLSLDASTDSTESQGNPDDMISNLLDVLQSSGSGDPASGTSAQDFLRAMQSYGAGQTPSAVTA